MLRVRLDGELLQLFQTIPCVTLYTEASLSHHHHHQHKYSLSLLSLALALSLSPPPPLFWTPQRESFWKGGSAS